MGKKILLDTNILIYRERSEELAPDLIALFQILSKNDFSQYVHPLSLDEVRGDKDSKRKKIQESKISVYPKLEIAPCPYDEHDTEYLSKINPKGKSENDHDKNDNRLLYAVYKGIVDFLITNDYTLLHKAEYAGCGSSVYSISGALDYFTALCPEVQSAPIPAGIIHQKMWNIDVKDPIFDSLKKEYPGFEEWFHDKGRENRKCYVTYKSIEGEKKLGSILITKIESDDNNLPTIPLLPRKKRLKISTLKVADVGRRIGEQFVSIAINEALVNKMDEIFITHFPELEHEDYLIDLIAEYGFVDAGIYLNNTSEKEEHLYLKKLYYDNPGVIDSPDEINKLYYPLFCDGESVRKFIVPIQTAFHDKLFLPTLSGSRQTKIGDYDDTFPDNEYVPVEGYAIKKAYLHHANTTKMRKGDIVIFYKSSSPRKKELRHSFGNQGSGRITTLGVIDEVYSNVNDVDEISRITRKRTVFDQNELEKLSQKPLNIILFKHNLTFNTELSLSKLKELGVLNGVPQSISEIPDDRYQILKQEGVIDGRFTIN